MSKSRQGISRRQVLSGAGAAALGAVTLRSSQSATAVNWDHEVDVAVIGSGIGAASASYASSKKGNKVLMLEKDKVFGALRRAQPALFGFLIIL